VINQTIHTYSQCSVCGKLLVRFPRDWFCQHCFETYEADIKVKAEWIKYLQNEERKRRYREEDMRKLEIKYIYGLGFIYDYDSENGKLVALREYYEDKELE
jgi:hypothetical protein